MKERLLHLSAALNEDPEFQLAARMWSGSVIFASGEDAIRLELRDGKVAGITESPAESDASIRVAGPPEGWQRMLAKVPQPFYQDLFGATVHHGFTLGGDIEDVGPYYPAIQRIIALMRSQEPS